jgi:hypothetical protein
MTNKELMEKLVVYYLKQDPEVVAKSLAGCLIDFERVRNYSLLDETEQDCLKARMDHNSRELYKFVSGKEDGPMRVENVENWFEVPLEGEND